METRWTIKDYLALLLALVLLPIAFIPCLIWAGVNKKFRNLLLGYDDDNC